MKTIKFCVFIYFILSIDLYSQYVQTPLGNNVVATTPTEGSSEDREEADDYYISRHPDAEPQDTYGLWYSTYRFNCHGYAWYMTTPAGDELDDPKWINNEALYMTDGSYKEVASEVFPGWVSWSTGDHTARTTTTTGVYLSKWAHGPLMEHDWDDSPFGTSNLKYYKLCYEEFTVETVSSDLSLDACKLHIENITINNNADFEVVYEDWIKIEGPFNANTGTTLYIHPD